MKKAILKMYGKTPAVVIALLRAVITAMTGNPYFAIPLPTLADFTTAVDAWAQAEIIVFNLKLQLSAAVADAKLKGKVAMELAIKEIAYVQVASGGNETIIKSAGMDIRDANAPDHGVPPQVQSLSLTHHDFFGHIDAHWDAVHHYGHVWYNIQYTFNNPMGPGAVTWIPFDHDVSSTTIDFSDPAHAGQVVWFQVRASNAAGSGEWSVAIPIVISSGVPAP